MYNTIFKYDLSKKYAKEFGERVQQLGAHETCRGAGLRSQQT